MAGRKGIVEFFDGRPQGMVLSLVLLLVRFFQDFLFEEGPFPGAEGKETGTDSLPRRLGQVQDRQPEFALGPEIGLDGILVYGKGAFESFRFGLCEEFLLEILDAMPKGRIQEGVGLLEEPVEKRFFLVPWRVVFVHGLTDRLDGFRRRFGMT